VQSVSGQFRQICVFIDALDELLQIFILQCLARAGSSSTLNWRFIT
jgi:hypothetical protein